MFVLGTRDISGDLVLIFFILAALYIAIALIVSVTIILYVDLYVCTNQILKKKFEKLLISKKFKKRPNLRCSRSISSSNEEPAAVDKLDCGDNGLSRRENLIQTNLIPEGSHSFLVSQTPSADEYDDKSCSR